MTILSPIYQRQKTDLDLFAAVWNQAQGVRTPQLHARILEWLQLQWRLGNRQLLLMAFRSCGKSTLVGLFAAWLLYQDPNMRILVLAAESALATKMVRNVKRILERHPLTGHLKPDNPEQWASARFTVRREGELRDPSMQAYGVGSNITGARADIVICDDVEVPNTSDTPDKREDLRTRLSELQFVLTPQGTQIYIGTPHAEETIYNTSKGGFLSGYADFRQPIMDAQGCSAWPERFTQADLERMQRSAGPAKFAAQMMLQPVNLSQARLDAGLIQTYNATLDYREARGRPYLELGGRKLVSCAAWWDPAFGAAKGDRSAVAILYMCHQGEYWLHHIGIITTTPEDDRDEATQQCAQVARLLRDHYVPAIHVEINGIGRFLPAILKRELKALEVRSAVIDVHNHQSKDGRILNAFDAVLAAQALHLHEDVAQGPFMAEMKEWRPGAGGRDDCLDAAACALLTQPVRIGARL